jgi:O-Antigen ligase
MSDLPGSHAGALPGGGQRRPRGAAYPPAAGVRRPGAAAGKGLPFLLWFVLIGTLASCVVDFGLFGFSFKGWIWVLTAVAAVAVAVSRWDHVSFPYGLWVPWIALVTLYCIIVPYPDALQRTLLLICPVLVGMAVSALAVNDHVIAVFLGVCRYFALALFFLSLARIGVLTTLALPSVTGLAPQAMTAALLANVFAAEYAMGRKQALRYWALMAALPFVAMTRTAMVAAAVTLPATFAPLRLMKRAALTGVVAAAAVIAFYSPRIQAKMFYTGTGTIADVSLDNPNFRTTGREWMWQHMEDEIKVKPWFGHGANAQEWFLASLFGELTQPHNDWLRLEFDYGYVGAALFALSLLLQMLHALIRGWRARGWSRLLLLAGASAFVSFAAIMVTDNIILYAVFFGNLQFALLGLAYGARHREVLSRRRALRAQYRHIPPGLGRTLAGPQAQFPRGGRLHARAS